MWPLAHRFRLQAENGLGGEPKKLPANAHGHYDFYGAFHSSD